ncbi:MAG: FtsW/RodA/SpoVE family cell cycle protein [Lachnospiraceae bacterium]|nr:FtsW/RodA/SpoVE family cell cycle protein [Lachnospiraceae bacterium]
MEEFIKILTEQMRCAKARDSVARELTNHIIDQTEVYEQSGMEHDKAVAKAVREMGDPVEIGVSMDRIHRPQTDWRMILLMFALSIAGLFCMMPIYGVERVLFRQGLFMLVGFAVTAVIYFIDYSIIGRVGAAAYIIVTILFIMGKHYMTVLNGRIPAMSILVYLYVPIFAGVLYQMRMRGYGAVFIGLVVCGATCLAMNYLSATFWVIVNIGGSMIVMLLAAIQKGMFGKCKKRMTAIVAAAVILPLTVLVWNISASWSAGSFRVMRLKAFLNREQYKEDAGYIYNVIADILRNAKFVGSGSSEYGVKLGVDVVRDNGLAPLFSIYTYGMIVGILLLILLAALVLRAVKIVYSQKNQLGFLVSMACMMVIFLNCLEGTLVNVGLFPFTNISMPFLAYGGSASFVYAVLIGLLLGVHRYEKVYTEETYADQPRWRMNLRIEKR